MLSWFPLLLPIANANEPIDPFLEPDEAEQFRTERQVVTVATRYAQTIEQAPSIITVITDDEIRQLGYRTLADVLRTIPGIYIAMSKESRHLGWVRGTVSTDNNKILLLVDGVPWYDGVYNHAWLDEYIPLFHVKQIEVIKGPGSAIYGTNAFAGVINVVTHSNSDTDYASGYLSVGSFARRNLGLMAAQTFENGLRISAYARLLDSEGQGMDVTPKGERNVTANNPRRSVNGGFRLDWKNTQFRYDFVDFRHIYFVNEQFDLFHVLGESVDEFNLNYRNDFMYLRHDISLGIYGKIGAYGYIHRYENTSNYGWFEDPELVTVEQAEVDPLSIKQANLSNPSQQMMASNRYGVAFPRTLVEANKLSERYGVGLEATLRPSFKHITTAGFGLDATIIRELEDYVFVDGSSSPLQPSSFYAPPNSSINDVFAYAQHTWTASWWLEVTGGARLDAYSHSGVFISPRVGLLMVPKSDLFIKMLWGRAFRAPNARESLVKLQLDENGEVRYTNGNPDLIPESIDTIEAEISGKPNRNLTLRSSVFYSLNIDEINKKIDDPPNPILGNQYYANLSSASALGGEIGMRWKPANYLTDMSYSFTHAVEHTNNFQQYEFPPHMAHVRLGWNPVTSFWLNLRSDIYGPRPRAQWTPNSQLGDGEPFALLHFSMAAQRKSDRRVRINASIMNLLNNRFRYLVFADDADAITGDGLPKYGNDITAEGRSFMAGIEGDF